MAASNYPACLAFTLKYEGGNSDDPRDPGGRTRKGVTQATYDAFRGRNGLPRQDVFAMPDAEMQQIYKNSYWDAVGGDSLRAGEDLVVFDFAVNSGPARALDVWRRCGGGKSPGAGIIDAMCAYRLSFLHALRTWSAFGAGWGRRVAACEAAALQMAGASLPDALDHAKGKKNGHGTAGPVVAGAGAAGTFHAILHGAAWATSALIAAIVLALAIMAFVHWRQGQRVDALTQAVKDMEARAAALKSSEAAEAAQKDAVRREIEKQQQQIKMAEAAEAAMPGATVQPAVAGSNKGTNK